MPGTENVLAVLSDIRHRNSYIAHCRFSQTLSIDTDKCNGQISSIWEDEILKAIHPDDLEMKIRQELLFLHHISMQPPARRFNLCLMQKLRMLTHTGHYTDVLHRIYYIPSPEHNTISHALCLYGAMPAHAAGITSVVADTMNGHTCTLDNSSGRNILSHQETAILGMIDKGNSSKEIADILNISIHTVSRHRQNIIAKLQARNSTEACHKAHCLGII